jgi:crotonobetainyl-CoA:carnitine CoA-transferase CaiB-like acyl-CoA transferase
LRANARVVLVPEMTAAKSGPTGPLAGYRVIEVGRFVTAPYACQLLADLGADVIKIEDPEGGDPFRGWGKEGGYASMFHAFNRNKRSLTLNLRQPRGREIVGKLAGNADVFVENFRPGTADKLGIGYATLSKLNPRLVYCSISGMGSDGPYAARPVYDIVGQGLSGLLSLLVDIKDPHPVGPTFSDTLTGLFAGYGILAALHARVRTGCGQLVETSLLQATMGFMNEPYTTYFGTGRAPGAYDRPRASKVCAFVCGDGLPIAIHLSSPEKFWRNFVTAAGKPEMIDDPRFRTGRDQQQNWHIVQSLLEPVFRTKTRQEWFDILVAAEVPVAPIYRLDEALEDPQVKHLGMLKTATHPERGEVKLMGFPVTLNDTPMGPVAAPDTLGEHTNEILGELGCSAEEIARMRDEGLV